MYLIIKRFFDILFSSLAIIILSPFLIPLIILLRLTGEGYIFYYQKRIGKNCNYFDIIKFATMLKDSPNLGSGTITLRNDPRITPMGKWLRKSKLNELPQLINVLKGDMSFVGPRPLLDKNFETIDKNIKEKIYKNKPGITGIGSVVFRDEEKILSENRDNPRDFYNNVIAPYKSELEIWYGKNLSFCTDIKILLLTAWAVILPKSKTYLRWFKNLPLHNL